MEFENTKFKIRDGFLNGTTLKTPCLSAGVFLFIGLSGVIRNVVKIYLGIKWSFN
jgi:hypothetical protein